MDEELTSKVDALLDPVVTPGQRAKVERNAEAFERRLRTVLRDLGLDALADGLMVTVADGFRSVTLPLLDGDVADRLLCRLEDIEHALPKDNRQIHQAETLGV